MQLNCRKNFAQLNVQIAASIDYAPLLYKGNFNLEGDADGLVFAMGTER